MVDKDHLKELCDAPEDKLSLVRSASRSIQMGLMFNNESAVDHYHAVVIKMQLTRHIPELMPSIVDELFVAFADSFQDIGGGNKVCGFSN